MDARYGGRGGGCCTRAFIAPEGRALFSLTDPVVAARHVYRISPPLVAGSAWFRGSGLASKRPNPGARGVYMRPRVTGLLYRHCDETYFFCGPTVARTAR